MMTVLRIAALLWLAVGTTAYSETSQTRLDRGIAATLQVPDSDGPHPAVLMLHGLGSSRNEVGNLFADAADAMEREGIASLRIDFRGFGESAGDTGAFTLDRQLEDAAIALTALAGTDRIDAERIGVMGFSFGAGAAIELGAARPDDVKSMVLWSSIADYDAQMLDSLGPKVFDRAREDGIVGIDLGWRTMALKQAFFESLAVHDLHDALRNYPGAFLTINGGDDSYQDYAADLLNAAAGDDKAVLAIPDADHVFHVYTPSASKVSDLIEATVKRFAQTL